MADVFVSYKAEDRRRVKSVVDALEADGFSVWWDEQIGSGAAWRQVIETELTAAKCVIVVWSKRSVGPDGEFVQDEAARAKQRRVYVPIKIDKVNVPLGFGETQATSLAGWTGDRSDRRYQSVLEAVRLLVSGPSSSSRVHVATPVVNRRLAIGGAAAVAVAAALTAGGWYVFRPKAAATSNRIAVLPFANLSGDPSQVYFSDGIAEELRSSLSRVGMQVIGRASCDAVRNLDIKTAAAKLGVANILTGSVRRSPQTIRIDTQLVNGSDGVELWSEAYDRPAGDVLKIQSDIATNVAQALSIALGQAGRAALTLGGTTNPAAQDLVLRVVHDTSDTELADERKLALLDAAISLDPNYAEAYARKAYLMTLKVGAYARTVDATRRQLAQALATANHAISIAPNFALGYAVRATVNLYQLQIGPAFADAMKGLALPGGDVNLGGLSTVLPLVKRFDEALKLNDRAISLDPLSPGPYGIRSITLFAAHRFSEAEASARRSLAIAPDQERIRGILGYALIFQGKLAEAEAEFQKLNPTDFRRLLGEGAIAARAGKRSAALDKVESLDRSYEEDHYDRAEIYAQLGMIESAIKELELAWNVRDIGLSWLRTDPFLDPIRGDPRIAVLERKLAYP